MVAKRTTLPVLLVAVLWLSSGCSNGWGEIEADGRDKGLVLILTGIQGNSPINEHIRQGLRGAGVVCAIEIRYFGVFWVFWGQIPGYFGDRYFGDRYLTQPSAATKRAFLAS